MNDYYEYYEKYMKIKFDSDETLPLNKTIEILILKVVIKTVFHENNKYYPHVFFRWIVSKVCNICHYWYFLN